MSWTLWPSPDLMRFMGEHPPVKARESTVFRTRGGLEGIMEHKWRPGECSEKAIRRNKRDLSLAVSPRRRTQPVLHLTGNNSSFPWRSIPWKGSRRPLDRRRSAGLTSSDLSGFTDFSPLWVRTPCAQHSPSLSLQHCLYGSSSSSRHTLYPL